MNKNLEYRYSNTNLLESPQTYQMTPFDGFDLLCAYKDSRNNVLKILGIGDKCEDLEVVTENDISECENYFNHKLPVIHTHVLLMYILTKVRKHETNSIMDHIIKMFVKRFEIKKRLFSLYNDEFKEASEDYSFLRNYILLSKICLSKYEESRSLKYLNVILKLNDTICSQIDKLREKYDVLLFRDVLSRELTHISELCNTKGMKI